LTHNCGDELAAARAAGVSLVFMNQWAKDDKRVAERFQEAVRVGSQGLVSAAIQRGVHGVQEDVYYKGDVVGQRTVYSDGLLTTLLKAKVPEFATGGDGAPQVTVNVANIMPRATTYEDWLAMKNSTLKAIAHTPADAEPVIEGEYTDATARLPDLL
jgi:hypothetical protein